LLTEPRRDFKLPIGDAEYLESLNLVWETIKPQNNAQWLLIHDWKLPPGYNTEAVIVALAIDANYADTQIDTVYFYPSLKRNDGKTINNVAELDLDGKKFQFWSRHRTAQNPWRAGVDDIASHLALVTEWLKREFNK
jgi:hypothetical protein